MSDPEELSSQVTVIASLKPSSDFENLLNVYRPYLLKIAKEALPRKIQSKVAPSDLVQETFLRATRTYESFRGETEQELKAWLIQILKRVGTDVHRAFRTQKRETKREISGLDGGDKGPVTLPGTVRSPSSLLSANEDLERLKMALGLLSEDHRQVVELFFFEGMEFAKIAERLGKSIDAIRKLWGRAIQKLAVILHFHE